jgi:hypothetical protein
MIAGDQALVQGFETVGALRAAADGSLYLLSDSHLCRLELP